MSTNEKTMKSEKSKMVSMILGSPGMEDYSKITMHLSRRNVLLLGRIIESGILEKSQEFSDDILREIPESSKSEFKVILEEMLKKSGLSEFYEKLKSL